MVSRFPDKMSQPARLLCLTLGGLGDLLSVLPVLRLLRWRYPAGRLTLVARPEYGLLMKETGVVDRLEADHQAKISSLFRAPGALDDRTNAFLRAFDLVFAWRLGASALPLERSGFFPGAKCRVFAFDPKLKISVSRQFFERTAEAVFRAGEDSPIFEEMTLLPLQEVHRNEGNSLLARSGLAPNKRYAVIHPGSGSLTKRWPLEHFLEIARRLHARGVVGVLVGGEAETDLEESRIFRNLPQGWAWIFHPPLIRLAGLLSSAALYVGNDSGITHLAAACGTRVVAFFRQDSEIHWRPNGRVDLLTAPDVKCIGLERAWSAVGAAL